jgi:hypothetical protein
MDSKYDNPDKDPLGRWRNDNPLRRERREHDRYAIQSPFTGALHYPGTSWRLPKARMKEVLEQWGSAYQRAVSLKAYLIDRYKNTAANSPGAVGPELFAARIVTLAAGPQYLGLNVDQETLSKDRCVEIVAYWNTR